MPNQTIRLRTLLRLTILLSCSLQAHFSVLAANVTVPDTDPSIVYQPPESWHASSDSCSTCLNPGASASYHEAIHPPLTNDTDDSPSSLTGAPTPTPPSVKVPIIPTSTHPLSQKPSAAPSPSAANSDGGPNDPNESSGKGKRSIMARFLRRPRLDIDDEGFEDPNISMAFNFTGKSKFAAVVLFFMVFDVLGSAIYLFAIQPPDVINANGTSSSMNLTFFMDNVPSGSVIKNSTPGSTEYIPGQLVFSRSDLTQGPHQLLINIGQNSTFMFDHLIYTEVNNGANSNSTTIVPTTPISQPLPSQTIDPKVKKHNVATFAGAVGGSVGVLGLFSLGLALSIIRRRQLAARRERLDRESLHTNASDDSPHMSGPAPFVPRYFPDTVIPPDPPTYMAALATNQNNSTLLATLPLSAFGTAHRSYADIPPATPPPPLDEPIMIPPPPPFPVAIATGRPLILPEGAMSFSIPGAQQPSHNVASVGSEPSNSAVAPELVPLLQPDTDTRPRSRASSRSVDVRETEPTEAMHLREDVS
ncbi:hypothetical protein BDZ97DRAFT_1919948 [Flammula alnicola]|nr:hypothetical protein BDZ97DRAFT_1919948 [Flammula alnicola]